MSKVKSETLKKEEKPVVAICYDFDKTLSPDDMQAQGFIQKLGYEISEFWKKSNGFAKANNMDKNLAYMFTMKTESAGKVLFTKTELAKFGSEVELFPGVKDWFERIRKYGEDKAFKKIYATSFYCDENGVAVWPAQVVNYTNKTQFLFRITKGILDVNDDAVNDFVAESDLRVPFRNMVYLGDSDTDIPCMKLVKTRGGYSIGVFNPKTNDRKKVHKMTQDNRIDYFVPADYSENTELDKLIKTIIKKTAYNELLENKKNADKLEARKRNPKLR